MSTLFDEKQIEVATKALELGACIRCSSRLAQMEYESAVSISQEELAKCLKDCGGVNAKTGSGTICVVCLGILQNIESNIAGLGADLKEAGYEFDGFQMNVGVPTPCLLRQMALQTAIKAELPNNHIVENVDLSLVPDIKTAFKWVAGPLLEKQLSAPNSREATLKINISHHHDCIKTEYDKLAEKEYGKSLNLRRTIRLVDGRRRKSYEPAGYAATVKVLETMSHDQVRDVTSVPPVATAEPAAFSFAFSSDTVYLTGRYMKLDRVVPQSPWLLDDGERKGELSVQEIIGAIVEPKYLAEQYKFHAAGREDIDVRMLGQGRPFLLEFVNPKKHVFSQENITEMEKRVNNSSHQVQIRGLRAADKSYFDQMKDGEENKRKHYRCVVRVSRSITAADLDILNSSKDLELHQLTPIRVLHRRSLMTRKRTVYSMNAEFINQRAFYLDLVTEAGTYIKEFVHGDLGRTVPSVGTLLKTDADILQLDVSNIEMDLDKDYANKPPVTD